MWTVNDGTGTTNATASTTTVLTIANTNQRPAIAAPATASAPEGAPITPITATATDADASNNLTITQSGKPASLTFTAQAPGPSPRTATISGTTTFTDAGTYSIVWTVNDGTGATNATASTTTVLNVGGPNRSPAITAPATASGTEGSPIATMIATATDADATDNLTITQAGKPVSLTFTAQAAGPSPRTAQITGTPAFGIAGTYSIVWTVNDGTGVINGTASTTTVLTIASGQNRCPVANPDGPYSGITGAPISFNGSGSFDPDGDPLTYAWDFGDGSTASGPTPVHAYLVGGNFAVTLTVTDTGHGDPTQVCIGTAATTAAIMPACPATVFNGYDVIKLATGKPTWFAFVQPAGGCYANTDVVTSSFVLKYAGNQIPADARRTSVGGDRSGDGIEEIRGTFTKADLRTLFAGLPNGHNMVEVTIGANLATGGMLAGTTQVDVVSSGSTSAAATISPNPMNPASTLTFTTTRSGSANVEMFDIAGHLVRTILDERWLSAGVHEVRIEGRGRRGESLASGVYFIRGVSADGEFKQTIAILK
ncbi:MAG: PKD domain-containing protein [Candidatus Eisenbacteria bacterium]|uniref:PKD domain-containing protein n=1 Tax=Eiseniibacteriota bacterium TaxID=2212470 RepID=A0A538STT1_UNCEI|nr:MAG: PKD domain-containing protein [Candidatus Eisenbacteria bacterium]